MELYAGDSNWQFGGGAGETSAGHHEAFPNKKRGRKTSRWGIGYRNVAVAWVSWTSIKKSCRGVGFQHIDCEEHALVLIPAISRTRIVLWSTNGGSRARVKRRRCFAEYHLATQIDRLQREVVSQVLAGVARERCHRAFFPLEVCGLVRYTTSRISFYKSEIIIYEMWLIT